MRYFNFPKMVMIQHKFFLIIGSFYCCDFVLSFPLKTSSKYTLGWGLWEMCVMATSTYLQMVNIRFIQECTVQCTGVNFSVVLLLWGGWGVVMNRSFPPITKEPRRNRHQWCNALPVESSVFVWDFSPCLSYQFADFPSLDKWPTSGIEENITL